MNPKQKLEQAGKAFLVAQDLELSAATSIYKSVSNPTDVEDDENTGERQQKSHPSVTIEAEGSHEEYIPFSNVFRGPMSVTVEADASTTTDEEFDAICSEVFGKFNIVELDSELSAALEDFAVQFAHITSIGSAVNNGQNWQAQMTIDVAYGQSDYGA
jgi:hypothetical protein